MAIGTAIGIPFKKSGQSWSSYWTSRYVSALAVTTTDFDKQTIVATIVGIGYDGVSFEYSTDNITFTVKGTSVNGTYNATGLTQDTVYFWRARLYKGTNYGNYSTANYGITKVDEITNYVARVVADGGTIVDETAMRATLASYDLDEIIFFWDKTAGIKLSGSNIEKIYDLKGNDFSQANGALQPLWIAGAGFNVTGNTQQLIGASTVSCGKRHTIEYNIDDPTSAGPLVLHDNSDDWNGLANFSVDKYTTAYLKHTGGATLSPAISGLTARTNVNNIKYERNGTTVVYTANSTVNNITLTYDSNFAFSRMGGYGGSATFANIGTIGKIIVYCDIQYHEVTVLTGGGGDYTSLTDAIAGISPTYFDRYIIHVSEMLSGYHIALKEYLEIRGNDKSTAGIIGYANPNIETEANINNYSTISLVFAQRKLTLSNLTISAQNLRYVIHLDPQAENHVNRYLIDMKIQDCDIIHNGNTEVFPVYGTYGYTLADAVGSGFCDNHRIEIVNCLLESKAIENGGQAGFRIHQLGTVPATASRLILSNCTCKSPSAAQECLGVNRDQTTDDLFAFNNVTLERGDFSNTTTVPETDVTEEVAGVLNGTIQVS